MRLNMKLCVLLAVCTAPATIVRSFTAPLPASRATARLGLKVHAVKDEGRLLSDLDEMGLENLIHLCQDVPEQCNVDDWQEAVANRVQEQIDLTHTRLEQLLQLRAELQERGIVVNCSSDKNASITDEKIGSLMASLDHELAGGDSSASPVKMRNPLERDTYIPG